MEHFLGALKPKADVRDYKIAAAAAEYPKSYICKNLPPVKNQRSVSSCVAHATAAILETLNTDETNQFVCLSTNFIYGMQGVAFNRLEGGMFLRDACKIVKDYGDPTEATIKGNKEQPGCTEWLAEQLTDKVYEEARNFRVLSYARCKTENDIKHALLNYGPVLASIKWYNKYEFNNGVIKFDTSSSYGYHAIMICGWDENGWICQNSWGRTWNGNGKFIYSYDDKLTEAWSFVDAENSDIVTPVRNSWIDIIYKAINSIINFFKSLRD